MTLEYREGPLVNIVSIPKPAGDQPFALIVEVKSVGNDIRTYTDIQQGRGQNIAPSHGKRDGLDAMPPVESRSKVPGQGSECEVHCN